MLAKFKAYAAIFGFALLAFLGFRSQHYKNKSDQLSKDLKASRESLEATKRQEKALAQSQQKAYQKVEDETDSSYQHRNHFE